MIAKPSHTATHVLSDNPEQKMFMSASKNIQDYKVELVNLGEIFIELIYEIDDPSDIRQFFSTCSRIITSIRRVPLDTQKYMLSTAAVSSYTLKDVPLSKIDFV